MKPLLLLRKMGLLIGGCLIGLAAPAQKPLDMATTPVPFLRIAPDARAGGMGDAGIATLPDVGAGFWNMGKVVFNEAEGGAAVSYIPWLKKVSNDVYFASAGGFYKPDEMQAISIGLRYFSLGNIQFTSNGRDNLGGSSPREMGVDIGYSRKLSGKLGLGIAARYIHSGLVNNMADPGYVYQNGSAVAADLGLYYDNRSEGDGFAFGAAFSNLGSKISYIKNAAEKDFIPANLGIGASWNKVFNEVHAVSIALDANKLLVPVPEGDSPDAVSSYRKQGVAESWGKSFADFPGQTSISTGIEYWYDQFFAVRAGYYTEAKSRGGRQYITTGIGLRYNMMGFNFSYLLPAGNGVNQNPLSNTLRFSLLLHLNNEYR